MRPMQAPPSSTGDVGASPAPPLAGFGQGASPAVVRLLGVTALSIAKHSFTHWGYALIAAIALALALWTKVHPILILIAGAAIGWGIGALTGPAMS